MALTRTQKQVQLKELQDLLKRSKSLIFMHYRGLSVADVSELRGKFIEKNAQMKVAKKTLFRIAAKEEGYPELPADALEGPIAFVCSFEDEMTGAKVAFEFGKSHEQIELIGGVLNGKILTKGEAVELAKMLSKEELLAKFVWLLRAPLSQFVSLCDIPLGGFARAVNKLAEKKLSSQE